MSVFRVKSVQCQNKHATTLNIDCHGEHVAMPQTVLILKIVTKHGMF